MHPYVNSGCYRDPRTTYAEHPPPGTRVILYLVPPASVCRRQTFISRRLTNREPKPDANRPACVHASKLLLTMPTLKRNPTNPQAGSSQPKKKSRKSKNSYVRSLPSPEFKYKDTTVAATTIAATGNILSPSLVLLAAGTGESERIGRRIRLTALSMRYVALLPNTTLASATDDGVRIIVFHDKQTNGAAATVADILADATPSYLSFNNLSNKSRFTILADKWIDISATAGAYTGTNDAWADKGVTGSIHLSLNNVPIEYAGTGATIAELKSNNIGVLCISDAGRIKVKHNTRVRYTDA